MAGEMQHLTLNTGHSRRSPRCEVDDDVIEMMQPLCQPGSYALSIAPGWKVDILPGEAGGLLFMVFHNERPVVACGVAGDDGQVDSVKFLFQMCKQTERNFHACNAPPNDATTNVRRTLTLQFIRF